MEVRRHMKTQSTLQDKICDWDELRAFAQMCREEGKTLAFTNGCFDVLHPGHVLYLHEAAKQADVLVLGLNSDDSVSRLKGPSRPIQDQNARALVLAGLESIARICIFDQDTPLDLIQLIQPHVLIKGGDYEIKDIVGAPEVTASGGKVLTVPFVEGHSSTSIIQKIQS